MATRSSPRKQGQAQSSQQASTSLGLPTGMDSLPSDLLFDTSKADFGTYFNKIMGTLEVVSFVLVRMYDFFAINFLTAINF